MDINASHRRRHLPQYLARVRQIVATALAFDVARVSADAQLRAARVVKDGVVSALRRVALTGHRRQRPKAAAG